MYVCSPVCSCVCTCVLTCVDARHQVLSAMTLLLFGSLPHLFIHVCPQQGMPVEVRGQPEGVGSLITMWFQDSIQAISQAWRQASFTHGASPSPPITVFSEIKPLTDLRAHWLPRLASELWNLPLPPAFPPPHHHHLLLMLNYRCAQLRSYLRRHFNNQAISTDSQIRVKNNKQTARLWHYTPLIRRWKQVDFWVRGHSHLQSEF